MIFSTHLKYLQPTHLDLLNFKASQLTFLHTRLQNLETSRSVKSLQTRSYQCCIPFMYTLVMPSMRMA